MRTSWIPAILLLCALTASLCAAGQSAAPASPQQPSAAPPAQSAPLQTAPIPTAPSQSAPSQAAPGQHGAVTHASPGQATDDNPLNLTEDQKAKLRPILIDERQQMEAVRNDSSMTTEQKMAKVQQIREAAAPKIKAILTAEQLQKLADMQQKAAPQQYQGAPAQAPPHN